MVSVKSLIAVAGIVATAASRPINCVINGQVVATTDSETGSCPWTIPASLPVNFDFTSPEEYLVDAYYVKGDSKFWNDIAQAGRIINIPVPQIVQNKLQGLFHVHLEQTPDANSTLAIRKRLFHEDYPIKRDDISNLVAQVEATDGTQVPESEVAPLEISIEEVSSSTAAPTGSASASGSAPVSGSASGSGSVEASITGSAEGSAAPIETITTTSYSTKVETITHCSDNKCSEKTEVVVECPTTISSGNEAITTTVWKPQETVLITVWDESCGCHKHVPATEGVVTSTIVENHQSQVVEIVTWCPVTSQGVITKTVCYDNKCSEVLAVATPTTITVTKNGQQTVEHQLVPTTDFITEGNCEVTVTVCANNVCQPTVVPGSTIPHVTTEGEQVITTTITVPVYATQVPVVETPPAGHTTYVNAKTTLEAEVKTAPCETCVPVVATITTTAGHANPVVTNPAVTNPAGGNPVVTHPGVASTLNSQSLAPHVTQGAAVVTPQEGAAVGLSAAKILVAAAAAVPLIL